MTLSARCRTIACRADYFGITMDHCLVGWTYLARCVRGRFLAMREEDFVMAAG